MKLTYIPLEYLKCNLNTKVWSYKCTNYYQKKPLINIFDKLFDKQKQQTEVSVYILTCFHCKEWWAANEIFPFKIKLKLNLHWKEIKCSVTSRHGLGRRQCRCCRSADRPGDNGVSDIRFYDANGVADKVSGLSSRLFMWSAWMIIGERAYAIFRFYGCVINSSYFRCFRSRSPGTACVGLRLSLSYRTAICEHILQCIGQGQGRA